MALPKVLVITGPTASGKSALAVRLARRFGGEVVSADSRQVYKGLDIGTGKVTRGERRGVPHHLLDVASPARTFTAAEYATHAEKALAGILARGKLPVVVGGSGFYIESLLHGGLPIVPPDRKLRARLVAKTTVQLFAMLRRLDPRRAASIDAKNPRRLIRAIEVARTLGKVPKRAPKTRYHALVIGLTVPPAVLRAKIRARLAKRLRAGMVAEAKRLHEKGLSYRRMEELGLEYRYLARYLENKISRTELFEQLAVEIYRYAKRQQTWWNHKNEVRWFAPSNERNIEAAVTRFLQKKKARRRA